MPDVILLRMNQRHGIMTGKQLAQGCYAVAWLGVEPTTLELQGRTLSTELLHSVTGMQTNHSHTININHPPAHQPPPNPPASRPDAIVSPSLSK